MIWLYLLAGAAISAYVSIFLAIRRHWDLERKMRVADREDKLAYFEWLQEWRKKEDALLIARYEKRNPFWNDLMEGVPR